VVKLTDPQEALVVANAEVPEAPGKLVVTAAARCVMLAVPVEFVVLVLVLTDTDTRLEVFESVP
jgi:hypothetical protein